MSRDIYSFTNDNILSLVSRRSGNMKSIMNLENGDLQIFNVADDPGEYFNLAPGMSTNELNKERTRLTTVYKNLKKRRTSPSRPVRTPESLRRKLKDLGYFN